MAELVLFVDLLVNGIPADGFPYSHRVEVENLENFTPCIQPLTLDYVPLPILEIFDLQALVVTAQREICLRINGQQDGQITLHPGGVLVLFDVDVMDSPQTNATIYNKGDLGATLISGFGAGSGLDDDREAPSDDLDTGDGGFGI